MNTPLSYFVKYKSSVDEISVADIKARVDESISTILTQLEQVDFNSELYHKISSQKDKIINDIADINEMISEFKESTTQYITTEEKAYLAQSYKVYEEGISQDKSDYILDRALFHALIYRDSIEEKFKSRIKAHSNWKHAGMFIRPEHGNYVSEMTASDPLYIVDESNALLNPIKRFWSIEYQARVRYKLIDENRSEIFKDFPEEQIGFVVAMNFFNHKPLGVIKLYLEEIYKLLKPGGTLLFTYNNCNMALAVQNFEKSLYSYTPESLVVPLTKLVGFELIESYNEISTNVSWLEIKKPGDLTSMRGGQCIAKINTDITK